jgi:hypothetical protein
LQTHEQLPRSKIVGFPLHPFKPQKSILATEDTEGVFAASSRTSASRCTGKNRIQGESAVGYLFKKG